MPTSLLTSLVVAALLGGEAQPVLQLAEPSAPVMMEWSEGESFACDDCFGGSARAPFESDDAAFPGFVGPISNPVYSKDPRSLTEVRLLFVNDWIPNQNPAFNGGNFQVYGMQARVALTERLSLIADKDGYAVINPDGADESDGWLNIAGGLKYLLIRDVENQFLFSVGSMYEFQSGEAEVFQGQGSGLISLFGTAGKQFGESTHFLATAGQILPTDRRFNSSYFYMDLHLDYELWGWLYPLVELNWFHYTSGGNWGIPSVVGEGDGLINIGTSGVTGNDLVTTAVGAKVRLNEHAELGVAWEAPISNRKDLIQHRLLCELILRY